MIFKILKVLLWPFRIVMGTVIRLFDRLVAPTPVRRSLEQQAQVDQRTAGLVLYHFEACPFCVKVRRHVRRLGLKLELRDIKRNPADAEELKKGGGEYQVPCLRIPRPGAADQWMYESSDINAYLSALVSAGPA